MHLPITTRDGLEFKQIRFPLKGKAQCRDHILHSIAKAKQSRWQRRHRSTCTVIVGRDESVWKDAEYGYIRFAYLKKKVA